MGNSPKETLSLSGIPLERRTILELGALGILRPGDNAGDWTTFCREMKRTSADSQIHVNLRSRERAQETLHMRLQEKIAKVRKAYLNDIGEDHIQSENTDRDTLKTYRRRFGGSPGPALSRRRESRRRLY